MAANQSRDPNTMPGLYNPSPSHARAKSQTNYFDPAPRFPYATETSGRQVIDSEGHETRKRSRNGDSEPSTTQNFATSSWGDSSLSNSRFDDTKSPPPLANDRYELAGGMDGSYSFTRRDGDYDDYFHLQKQRGNWSVPPTPHVGVTRQLAAGEMHTTPNESRSWSLMGLVGGVAGKLFQFCTVPFRGFQAGGGHRYNMDLQGDVAAKLGLQDNAYQAGPVQQTTPGHFPGDDYGVQSMESVTPERPRMTKRLRTADNWVVIGTDGETESRPSTPRLSERRLPSQARSPSQIPRPVSRAATTTPSLKRPSLIPVSRRSTTDRRSFYGSTNTLPGSHTRSRSYSRQSYGSPVMFEQDQASKPSSPLPKESQRLINKVRREEMEEDERMRRMNLQMTAMLREANEALGTKFEVEEYDDDNTGDGGYVGYGQQPSWYS
ncbi:hypothetical protein BDW02DRAFT_570793 [Decorospora gaudefroyi]|uniref:Uncharacterized protein n=1 Tax=Decorospora gaudefroyi TaxID=184978 RepID=A0A6A5KBU5_9PLEO|nr:hypothetical protein BDW02DRAFT_570793 [Decorospora gaudefroyi]